VDEESETRRNVGNQQCWKADYQKEKGLVPMNKIYVSIGQLKESLQKFENAFIVERGKVRGIPILGHVIHFEDGPTKTPVIYKLILDKSNIRVKKILPGSNYAAAVLNIIDTGFTCNLPGWIYVSSITPL